MDRCRHHRGTEISTQDSVQVITAVLAVFMRFLAIFLGSFGFNLSSVFMCMGVIIGSTQGPASRESANVIGIPAGTIGDLGS